MSAITVLSLLPGLSNIHGDAANAAVLATRARWRGVETRVIDLAPGAAAPRQQPHAIVLGSGFDAEAARTLEALRGIAAPLRAWVDDGVPLLAVGLGWELLATRVELAAGTVLEGLGVFAGQALPAARATGDVVVDSPFGPLIGYEYHVRDYVPSADELPLGTVLSGVGNRSGSGVEGARAGSAIGTHLRGPILARNPHLADHLLGIAAERAGVRLGDAAPELIAADRWTRSVNERTRHALGHR